MTGGRRAGPRRCWVAPACARLTWASLAKARLSTRHPLVLVVNYLIVGTAYLYRLSHAGGQGTPATIRVLIVDDQRLMRDGLRTLLELQDGLVVIGEAGDGSQALPLIEQLQPDVVLMDVRMPRMDGVEATRALTRRGPRPRVLVLTTFDDDQYVYEALQAGAAGYVLKDLGAPELAAAIRVVHRGGVQLEPTVASKVVAELRRLQSASDPPPTPPTVPAPQRQSGSLVGEELTPCEHEVLRLITAGASNREIAERLVLSEGTVKNHISNILGRLGLRDRTQAAIYAKEHGLA